MNVLSWNIHDLGISSKADWIRGIHLKHEVSFMLIQETQFVSLDSVELGRFWGNTDYMFDWVPSGGRSGGLLSIWDPNVFSMEVVVKSSNYLLISGKVKGSGVATHVLNVYAPQHFVDKRVLWSEIGGLVGEGEGMWIVAGDFNSIRCESDTHNSVYVPADANEFNGFIDDTNLHEYSLKGRRFTFPSAEYLAIERYMSDHSPLILKTVSRNFGPKPFRFYNSWLSREDFRENVKKALETGVFVGDPDTKLSMKFKWLRFNISTWAAECKIKELEEKRMLE
ncbi:uncharacterized protein LOC110931139 [Helianthus annuus]|uniref:uncharacterized protein LOC110931139 n=1 Tax=Helianthus annuus TaxID=4232 RepID=UPI000B906BEC|nr:uncharacterized protein LOC110931139 [Helianthus annuus]